MKAPHKAVLIGIAIALYSTAASAQLTNQGMLDQVVTEFATRASSWQTIVLNAATWLFWLLATISLVWTFGFMALRKADIGEFFAELIRFTIFTGFFWWLLTNGPAFANSIIRSLARIGEQASGVTAVTPSGIVDVGFMILKQALRNSSVWSPIDSLIGMALSVGILILLAVIAVNMLLLLVAGWLLAYAGIFFLGFGGSRWTSDMAINYYKTVLGVAVQIMTMVLLVGIGNDLLSSFYGRMNARTLNFEELGVMLVFCVALLMLINRVPPLVAGVITGSGIGGAGGIGNFGAGAAIGAAGMAAAAVATAGAAIAAGAASAAGGAQAVMAAFSKASENVSSGTDVMSGLMGGGGGDSGGGGGGGGGGGDAGTSTPLAQAAGFGGGSGGDSGGGGESKGGDKGGSSSQGGGDGGSKASGGGDAGGAKAGQDGGGQQGQGAGQGGQQAAPGSTGPGLLASAASPLGTAGRIAADAGANLAKGAGDVAKAKAASMRDSAMERIADTTGGKIAAAIKAGQAASETAAMPTFDNNTLAGADASADPVSEVAAFANRDGDRSDKSA